MSTSATNNYDTRQEAIVAALDEMEEGDTLYVHHEGCQVSKGKCSCQPEIWTY